MLLFNVVTDPGDQTRDRTPFPPALSRQCAPRVHPNPNPDTALGEHQEVSAEYPDIVKRLSDKLDAMRATAVTAKDKLICSNRTHVHTDQGSYVVPHCNISRV